MSVEKFIPPHLSRLPDEVVRELRLHAENCKQLECGVLQCAVRLFVEGIDGLERKISQEKIFNRVSRELAILETPGHHECVLRLLLLTEMADDINRYLENATKNYNFIAARIMVDEYEVGLDLLDILFSALQFTSWGTRFEKQRHQLVVVLLRKGVVNISAGLDDLLTMRPNRNLRKLFCGFRRSTKVFERRLTLARRRRLVALLNSTILIPELNAIVVGYCI